METFLKYDKCFLHIDILLLTICFRKLIEMFFVTIDDRKWSKFIRATSGNSLFPVAGLSKYQVSRSATKISSRKKKLNLFFLAFCRLYISSEINSL